MDVSFLILSGASIVGGLGLVFVFSNGYRDSSTIVATVVSTRTLGPRSAFGWCAIFEFLGALFFGTAIAVTISKGMFGSVLDRDKTQLLIVISSALISAIIWGVISWWRAWPTSNSQALFGGIIGAGTACWGPTYFQNSTVTKVLVILILSPVLGFVFSGIITGALRKIGEWMTPRVRPYVNKLQVISCMAVSFAHGSNDGQIAMGVIALSFGVFAGTFDIPLSTRLAVAMSLSIGVLIGGRRILKKLGMSFYRIRPVQGLGAQLSSAGTVLGCAMTGFPASTTQVITGSIVGAGVAKNLSSVRWGIAESIVLSWIITIPSVSLLSYVTTWSLIHVVF